MANTTARTIRVLLIDDHRSVLWGLESLINSQKQKMQVVGKFTSYAEASAQLETLLPDIVLLDLDLGTEQGIDIIPRLTQATSAKILVLTGSRDVALHDNAIIAGAKGVLEKANSADIILKAIERVHEGQLWVDHDRMERIIQELSRKKSTAENNPEQKKIDSLTIRELHIVTAMTARAGATGSDVAKELHISESTLRNHLSSIYTKLDLTNRLELWDYAYRHKLNKPEK
jgi:two-component system, NarL family, nitrate/nitrite response regulator NarL